MRRQWAVRRSERPAPDGQHRWDRAYQHLLAWATRQPVEEAHGSLPCRPPPPEGNHESRSIREGLYPTSSADPKP